MYNPTWNKREYIYKKVAYQKNRVMVRNAEIVIKNFCILFYLLLFISEKKKCD
jgi:hypothetical protein